MKSKIKYLILTSFMAVLLFGTVINVNAAESGVCGKNLTYTLDDSGTLTISGTGDMDFYGYSPLWSSSKDKIKSVVIGEGVSSIGEEAFYGCQNLTSVTMPTSVKSIGGAAFYYCVGLESISISEGVTSIAENVFNYCSSLSSINVSDNNTSYSSVNGNLYNKSHTQLLRYAPGKKQSTFSIPNGITFIGNYAFDGCGCLTSVDIPDEVVFIGDYAFNLTGLTNVSLPDNVAHIGEYAFFECSMLKNINIPKGVENIGVRAFGKCYDLESINVSKENTSYTSVNGDLYDKSCTNFLVYAPGKKQSTFSIPNGVETIGKYAFSNCGNIINVTIPNSVIYIGNSAFFGCNNLAGITIGKGVTSVEAYAFSSCRLLTAVRYIGDKESWNNIKIGISNDTLRNANLIFLKTVTYIGDYSGEETAEYGSNAVLPIPPEGYSYKFTANGEEWDGTNITSDVTVTVTKLCDKCEVVEIGDCYDIAANGDTLNVSTYFGKIFCDEISVSEGANVKVYSNENCTGDSFEYINITGNSAVVYMVVTAESGRTQTYKAQFLRTAVDLGQIEYTDDRDGLIILKLKKAAPGEPKIYVAYSKNGTNYTYAEAKYNPETLSIQLSGLEGQTKYFVKVAADYRLCSGEYAESNVIEILTKKIISSACDITKIISPPSAVFNQETRTITAKVANAFSEYQINVEVSEGATWGVYRTITAEKPLSENKLKLYEGETTTAYIKVVAEDGTNKLYTIKIYRQKKSALPEISYTDGKVTITAPEGSTIIYTTDNKTPIPGVYGNAYTGAFTAEIGSIVKAIALNPDAEEYSDIASLYISPAADVTAERFRLSVKNGTVEFGYYLQANDKTNLNGTFYLAAYNGNDVLVGLYTEEVKEDSTEYDLSGAMTVSETPAYFKAFFWGGESGMKPLRNNVTKDKES